MKILAIGAHPDDIEFGCAAVLIKEIKQSNPVKLLVLSRGEAGSSGTAEEREQESRAAARLMGAEGIEFLDFGGDCHLEYHPRNSIRLAAEIRKTKPDIVLAPSWQENQHPDHSIAGRLVRDACRLARYGGLGELGAFAPHAVGTLLYYNITLHVGQKPDIIVDITEVFEEWQSTMRCHQTQVRAKHYLELQTTAARLLGLAAGTGYAIGLYTNDPIRVSYLSEIASSAREF